MKYGNIGEQRSNMVSSTQAQTKQNVLKSLQNFILEGISYLREDHRNLSSKQKNISRIKLLT